MAPSALADRGVWTDDGPLDGSAAVADAATVSFVAPSLACCSRPIGRVVGDV